MKLTKWENPKNNEDIRMYINGLYTYQKGVFLPKFFLIKKDDTFLLKSSKEFDLNEAEIKFRENLLEMKKISSIKDLITWDLIEDIEAGFSKQKKEKKVESVVKKEEKEKDESFKKTSDLIYQNYKEIKDIRFEQDIKLKLNHNLPATIKDFLIEHPQIEAEVLNLPEGSILFEYANSSLIIEIIECKSEDYNENPLFLHEITKKSNLLNYSKMSMLGNAIPVIIFEGQSYKENSIMSPVDIDEFYAMLISNKKISVLNTYNKLQTANFIFKLIDNLIKKTSSLNEFNNIDEKKEETKRCILMRIPTLNTNDVNVIMNKKISIKELADMPIEKIMEFEGFDIKKSLTLKRILDS